MEFGWFDGREDDEYSGVGFVEISTVFATHDADVFLDNVI